MKVKYSNLQKFKEERGAAKIVEYSLILPVCLFIFAMLILAGYYLNQKAVLDAAVNRGAVVAQKIYCDANVNTVMDLGVTDGSKQVGTKVKSGGFTSGAFKSDPYRYLKFWKRYNEIYSAVEKKIINSVKATQIADTTSRLSTLKVDVPHKFKGFIIYKMTVSVSQEFYNPFVPRLLRGEKGWYGIKASSTVSIMNTVEFIRTTDLVDDIIERYTGSEVGTKVRDMMNKLNTFMAKTD